MASGRSRCTRWAESGRTSTVPLSVSARRRWPASQRVAVKRELPPVATRSVVGAIAPTGPATQLGDLGGQLPAARQFVPEQHPRRRGAVPGPGGCLRQQIPVRPAADPDEQPPQRRTQQLRYADPAEEPQERPHRPVTARPRVEASASPVSEVRLVSTRTSLVTSSGRVSAQRSAASPPIECPTSPTSAPAGTPAAVRNSSTSDVIGVRHGSMTRTSSPRQQLDDPAELLRSLGQAGQHDPDHGHRRKACLRPGSNVANNKQTSSPRRHVNQRIDCGVSYTVQVDLGRPKSQRTSGMIAWCGRNSRK